MRLNPTLKKSAFRFSVAICFTLGLMTFATAQDLTGIKCVVNGKKAATAEATVEYKQGKVYFCCDHCADAFKKDMELKDKAKYALKANHQLVLTGQYVQKGCPMSGEKFDESTLIDVGGTKVGFCCQECMKKVENAENLEAKSKFVFTNAAFKNGFKKKSDINLDDVKCILMTKKNVVADKSVDYKEGKVYFCCDRCVKKFSSAPEDFSTAANRQLVATGQFVQTGCPISGGDVDEEQSSVVGGVTVKFCCEKCKAKVDGSKSDEAKASLVFGAKGFKKAFSKN